MLIEDNTDIGRELEIYKAKSAVKFEHTDTNLQFISTYKEEKEQLLGKKVLYGCGSKEIAWKVIIDVPLQSPPQAVA